MEIWKHKWNLSVEILGWNFKTKIKLFQLHCRALLLLWRREVVIMSFKPIPDLAERWPQNFVVKPTTSIHKLSAILVRNHDNSRATQCNVANDFSNWLVHPYNLTQLNGRVDRNHISYQLTQANQLKVYKRLINSTSNL